MAKKPAAPKAPKHPKTVAAPVAPPPPPVETEVIETPEQSLKVQSIADALATMPKDISTPESLEAAEIERASERVSRASSDRNKYGRAH